MHDPTETAEGSDRKTQQVSQLLVRLRLVQRPPEEEEVEEAQEKVVEEEQAKSKQQQLKFQLQLRFLARSQEVEAMKDFFLLFFN